MIVDFKIPDELGPWVYIDRVLVFVIEEGYKGWLEGATTDAAATLVEPIPDFRLDGYWRGVHGYISFGQEGGAIQNEQPGADDVTTHPLWFGCEFINWKQQMFVAPRRKSFIQDGKEVLGIGMNAFRCWLRPNVRVFCKIWLFQIDPFVSGGAIRTRPDGPWQPSHPTP